MGARTDTPNPSTAKPIQPISAVGASAAITDPNAASPAPAPSTPAPLRRRISPCPERRPAPMVRPSSVGASAPPTAPAPRLRSRCSADHASVACSAMKPMQMTTPARAMIPQGSGARLPLPASSWGTTTSPPRATSAATNVTPVAPRKMPQIGTPAPRAMPAASAAQA